MEGDTYLLRPRTDPLRLVCNAIPIFNSVADVQARKNRGWTVEVIQAIDAADSMSRTPHVFGALEPSLLFLNRLSLSFLRMLQLHRQQKEETTRQTESRPSGIQINLYLAMDAGLGHFPQSVQTTELLDSRTRSVPTLLAYVHESFDHRTPSERMQPKPQAIHLSAEDQTDF